MIHERQEENDSSPMANSALNSLLQEDQLSECSTLQCDECELKLDNENHFNNHKRSYHSKAVTLEIYEFGNIVGPQLPSNSSPPSRVLHPIAGKGCLRPTARPLGFLWRYLHLLQLPG